MTFAFQSTTLLDDDCLEDEKEGY